MHSRPLLDDGLMTAARIDVTLRDGAFPAGFKWTLDDAETVVSAASAAKYEFIEIGYLGGPPDAHGMTFDNDTGVVTERLIERLVATAGSARLLAMLHPTVSLHPQALQRARECGLFGVRFVYHPSWASRLRDFAAAATELGLWHSVNLALVSHYEGDRLAAALASCAESAPQAVYLADTCAGLVPTDVVPIVDAALQLKIPLGVHMHDHLGLALANSLVAVRSGAALVDVSIGGVGRGAGNLQGELWECLRSARSGDWAPVHALLAAKKAVARRTGSARCINWPSVVSGALNLLPPEEDGIARALALAPAPDEQQLLSATLKHVRSVLEREPLCRV